MTGRARFAFTVLAFGYAFLYLPIALVIVYSFNESRLVTVWAGFSTKWWEALFAQRGDARRRLAVAAHRRWSAPRSPRCSASPPAMRWPACRASPAAPCSPAW